jgi:hypothetical protein
MPPKPRGLIARRVEQDAAAQDNPRMKDSFTADAERNSLLGKKINAARSVADKDGGYRLCSPYPPTMASSWDRCARAGRSERRCRCERS